MKNEKSSHVENKNNLLYRTPNISKIGAIPPA